MKDYKFVAELIAPDTKHQEPPSHKTLTSICTLIKTKKNKKIGPGLGFYTYTRDGPFSVP